MRIFWICLQCNVQVNNLHCQAFVNDIDTTWTRRDVNLHWYSALLIIWMQFIYCCFVLFFQANQRKLQTRVAELRYADGVLAVIPCAMTWTQKGLNLHWMQSCISNVQVSKISLQSKMQHFLSYYKEIVCFAMVGIWWYDGIIDALALVKLGLDC